MDIRDQMEKIYKDIPLENIPWNLKEPPHVLIKAVEAGTIKPCKVVDLGCGAGNYSVWLARKGFDVTGIDISDQAIKHAEKLAAREGVSCRFVVADLLGDLKEYRECFDLAIDWEVLHHIFPENRSKYVKNVKSILRSGGLYFSVCFSEQDSAFGGKGKYRETPLGTRLYFSAEDELKQLFEPCFKIIELTTKEVAGKYAPHMVNVAWLRKLP